MADVDAITGEIVDAAVKLHRRLGPGLLESVYLRLLAADLERRGRRVERQLVVGFEYEGIVFERGLRLDLLVDDLVVVELKSVAALNPSHFKQILTYLRLLHLPVGLLINFGGATLKEGLRRVVNNYQPSAAPLPPRLRVNTG
jgi:GxxExxY protein